jgi:hypothetical protein
MYCYGLPSWFSKFNNSCTHNPPKVCVESLLGVVQEAVLKRFASQFGTDQADEFSKNDVNMGRGIIVTLLP